MTSEDAGQVITCVQGIVRLRIHAATEIVTYKDSETYMVVDIWRVGTQRPIDKYVTKEGALARIEQERRAAEADVVLQARWVAIEHAAALSVKEQGMG